MQETDFAVVTQCITVFVCIVTVCVTFLMALVLVTNKGDSNE